MLKPKCVKTNCNLSTNRDLSFYKYDTLEIHR